MKGFFFTIILILISVISVKTGFAQDRVIHGQVFTFDSIPLINATIKVKSSKQEVHSDEVGKFSVGCNKDDVLTITAEGFYKQKVELDEKVKLVIVNLKLKPGDRNREVAIGYGHVADKDLPYSVSNMNSSDLDFSQYANMYDLIQGKLPGVQIYNGEVIIRGVSSINNHAALIVVDGVISDNSILSALSTSQVTNISVLKDGGTALYGSRGANGVVLIETKGSNNK
jgi:TonB-dependent SusC/RagA subfamily outer membrane receptor